MRILQRLALKTGDIVLIQDSNLGRGQWRLGIVSNTFPGCDGKVRKVEVQYKNPKQGEPVTKYQGRGYVTIERPVHQDVHFGPLKLLKFCTFTISISGLINLQIPFCGGECFVEKFYDQSLS